MTSQQAGAALALIVIACAAVLIIAGTLRLAVWLWP